MNTMHPDLTTCRECGAFVDPKLGAMPPGTVGAREGTVDSPRAPGDYNDICDACNYSEEFLTDKKETR